MRPRDIIGTVETWHSYFYIRLSHDHRNYGYYVSFKGKREAVDGYHESYIDARDSFLSDFTLWRRLVDESFEKEVLGGSEHSETKSASED